MRVVVVVVLAVVGCGSSSDPKPPPVVVAPAPIVIVPDAAPPPVDAAPPPIAMPVAFGACASSGTRWNSGGMLPPPPPIDLDSLDLGGAPLPGDSIGNGNVLNGNQGPPGGNTIDVGNVQIGTGVGRIGRVGIVGQTIARPGITMGQMTVLGSLDQAIIRRFVRAQFPKLEYCYESRLRAVPELAGKVTSRFFVAPSGAVVSAQAEGVDPEVANCFATVLHQMELPKPTGGGGVQVTLPFTLAVPPPTPPPAPRPPPPPKPLVDPLRGESDAIAACARGGSARSGVAVIDYGAKGVTVFGIDDASVRECIAAVATRVAPPKLAQRCSLAFGELAIDTLPAIDLDATTVADAALGKTIAAAIPKPKPAEVVQLGGVVVVRPANDTPMKVVAFAIGKLIAAREDFVLAARRGSDWKLLSPIALPRAPVVRGNDPRWNPLKGPAKLVIATKKLATYADLVAAIDAAAGGWVLGDP